MKTAEKTAKGPDYWFVDPAYYGIDRLAEDECPMDYVQEAEDREADDKFVAAIHGLRCPYGSHLPENCPAGGV